MSLLRGRIYDDEDLESTVGFAPLRARYTPQYISQYIPRARSIAFPVRPETMERELQQNINNSDNLA